VGHAALDVAGMVPVIGEAADVANGIWYAAEGNYEDAALSMAAAVPGIGMAATAAKYAKKGAKAVDAVKGGSKGGKGAKATKPKSSKPKHAKPKQKKPSKKGGECKKGSKKKNSFVPGTKVLMADGSEKKIEDVKAGDWVVASDPETGNLEYRQVTDTMVGQGVKHLVTLTVDIDGKDGKAQPSKITATAGHPFWLPDYGRWADAGELEPGMWLQTAAGTWVQVTAVDDAHRSQRVHNLTVEGQHTYFVTVGGAPVLVHNANTGPTPGACAVTGGPYRGGQYKDLHAKQGQIERNHMPASQAIQDAWGMPEGQGLAIQMSRADHLKTESWGSSHAGKLHRAHQAYLLRQGRLTEAVQMDIDNVKSMFPGRYDSAIDEMLTYLPQFIDAANRAGFTKPII
jgi:hypothetical protein